MSLLGTLGLGALGVVTAPALPNRGLEGFLGGVAGKDPTGLTGLLPNGGGFRLLLGRRLRPAPDRRRLPPHPRRPGRPPARLHPRRAARPAADPAGQGTSSASPAGGCRAPLRGRAAVPPARRGRRRPSRPGPPLHLLRRHLHREPHARPGPPPGRPGRPAHAGRGHRPRPRRPGPPLRRPHVLLQVRQVALRHHRHRPGAARLLGGARLRRRRLGGPLERTVR
ncbi:hypothetical protein LT493_06245 [Streptomyces tricolor]|nr:hypothetical protein [Streptomyces tricolor]